MLDVLREFQSDMVGYLRSEPGLVAALGGPCVYDSTPRKAHPPYIVIERYDGRQTEGQLSRMVRAEIDWEIWLAGYNRQCGLSIAAKLVDALTKAGLANPTYRLVSYSNPLIRSRTDSKSGWTSILVETGFSLEDLSI